MRDPARAQSCSLICRILGNPLAYRIVCAIGRHRRRPIELAKELGASASSIVNQLKILKAGRLVQYHSTGIRRKGRVVHYWISDPDLLQVCRLSERLVQRLGRV